jgi:hypothetical protein
MGERARIKEVKKYREEKKKKNIGPYRLCKEADEQAVGSQVYP